MRRAWLVTYDICEPKRLRQVYQVCRAFGDHIQYSVFRCDLTEAMKVRFLSMLDAVVNHKEDQVLLIPLGASDEAVDRTFETVGQPYQRRPRRSTIV